MEPKDLESSDPAIRRLVDSLNALQADSHFILDGLIAFLESQPPVVRNRFTDEQREVFLEARGMTSEQLAEAEGEVDRGALELSGSESWLLRALDTRSVEETARYMGLTEEETAVAVTEGRLYGIEIAGRLRFPVWQMNVGRPERTVKGLERIIAAAASAGWSHERLSAYMEVPQEDLIEEGRLTPLTWLQDIGDVDEIISLIEASAWI